MVMEISSTSSSQIDAMAAQVDGTDGVALMVLQKAMTQNVEAALQLLQALPQKDGAGQLLDMQL